MQAALSNHYYIAEMIMHAHEYDERLISRAINLKSTTGNDKLAVYALLIIN